MATEVGGRGEGRHPWSCQNIQRLSPVLDKHESEPRVMPEHDPKDRQHSHAVQEEQIFVLHRPGNGQDLSKVVEEAETFNHLDNLTLVFGHTPHH